MSWPKWWKHPWPQQAQQRPVTPKNETEIIAPIAIKPGDLVMMAREDQGRPSRILSIQRGGEVIWTEADAKPGEEN